MVWVDRLRSQVQSGALGYTSEGESQEEGGQNDNPTRLSIYLLNDMQITL